MTLEISYSKENGDKSQRVITLIYTITGDSKYNLIRP